MMSSFFSACLTLFNGGQKTLFEFRKVRFPKYVFFLEMKDVQFSLRA